MFVGADYVHQHWTDLDRSVDLNAPSPFDRTAPGQTRSVAAANATRPIVPVNGGVRTVNVLMNLGVADYNGLQTQVTLSRQRADVRVAQLHAVQGDQHHRAGRQRHRRRTKRTSRASAKRSAARAWSISAIARSITFSYQLPYNITAGTVTQLASARPFNATTGIDNNGDGANNDRPVDRRRGHRQVGVPRHGHAGRVACSSRSASSCAVSTVLLRLEGFNLFNHGNFLGRGQTTYGDTTTVERDIRAARERRHGDQRAAGVRQHRSAADVPAPGALSVLRLSGSRETAPAFARADAGGQCGAPFNRPTFEVPNVACEGLRRR